MPDDTETTKHDFTGPAWTAFAEASAAETAARLALKAAEHHALSLRAAAFLEVGESGVHEALCKLEAEDAC